MEEAAGQLENKLKEKFEKKKFEKVFFVTHGHGGQVLRKFLEKIMVDSKNPLLSSGIHVVTINMPLVIGGRTNTLPIIAKWLNFQTRGNLVQKMGFFFMIKYPKKGARQAREEDLSYGYHNR